MSTSELYVKSEDEMNELFSYIPKAIQNTAEIAEMQCGDRVWKNCIYLSLMCPRVIARMNI